MSTSPGGTNQISTVALQGVPTVTTPPLVESSMKVTNPPPATTLPPNELSLRVTGPPPVTPPPPPKELSLGVSGTSLATTQTTREPQVPKTTNESSATMEKEKLLDEFPWACGVKSVRIELLNTLINLFTNSCKKNVFR